MRLGRTGGADSGAAGHAYARLFDTGKKHNSGVMVQQIKWSPTMLDQLRHTGSLL